MATVHLVEPLTSGSKKSCVTALLNTLSIHEGQKQITPAMLIGDMSVISITGISLSPSLSPTPT